MKITTLKHCMYIGTYLALDLDLKRESESSEIAHPSDSESEIVSTQL